MPDIDEYDDDETGAGFRDAEFDDPDTVDDADELDDFGEDEDEDETDEDE